METLKFEELGGIGVLTISRPKALNALNSQVIEELGGFLDQAEKSSTLRCLILTGDGEKAFVAGADIKEINGIKATEAESFARRGQKVFSRLEEMGFPVIAAVNGFALGGGCELAMCCDFIYAADSASFGLPEVSLGLIPGYGGTQRLSRYVGLPMAKELVFTGRRIKADEALRIGLVNKVVPLSELLNACKATAQEIMTKGPLAVGYAKKSAQEGASLGLEAGLTLEARLFRDVFSTEDVQEGTTAFMEKRAPNFKGK